MVQIAGRYLDDKKSYVASVTTDHLTVSRRTAVAPATRVAYRFDALLVVLTRTGEIRFSADQTTQTIHHRRADMLLVPRGVAIYTDYLQPTAAAPLACITLEIDAPLVDAVRHAAPALWPDAEDYRPLCTLDGIDAFSHAEAVAAIGRIDRLLHADAAVPARAALVDTATRELLLHAMQSRARAALCAPSSRSARLGQLVQYIDAHLDAALDTAALARRCHMSRSAFHAHFVATLGQTPAAFVRARRITRAQQLLLASADAPVSAVAAACGFGNVSHFVQVFRRHAGCAPAAFRRAAQR